VDDLIQVRVNRIEFNHLIGNLDSEEEEAKEEEEVEEKVEKENL